MTIKEEYIAIKWNPCTKAYYESLGYQYTKVGQELTIKISELPETSGVRITAICDDCGIERSLRRNDYSEYCVCCATKRRYYDQDYVDKRNKIFRSKEYREKRSGENHHAWKPELTDEDRKLRKRTSGPHKNWANAVKKRDKNICQVCFVYYKFLDAHHLFSYSSNPELRLDINNGVSLCKNCHIKFHSQFGQTNNTREQFRLFRIQEIQKCL